MRPKRESLSEEYQEEHVVLLWLTYRVIIIVVRHVEGCLFGWLDWVDLLIEFV